MYVNADFAETWPKKHANLHDLRDHVLSCTGYIITYCSCPITWASKLQTEITLSTTEAEYIGLSMATRQLFLIRHLMDEITSKGPIKICWNKTNNMTSSLPHLPPSIVYEDNARCLALANSDHHHLRTKHISLKWHHFKEQIRSGKLTLQRVSSATNLADILTKHSTHECLHQCIMGWLPLSLHSPLHTRED
jgi:hypothetical protein